MRVGRRPAVESDRAFILDVQLAALGGYAIAAFGGDQAELRRRIDDDLILAGCEVISADGRDVGCLAVLDRGDHLFLEVVALLPGAQRRGIGTELVRELMTRAQAAGVPVRLNVLKVNPARALYERLGFYVVGADERRWLMQWP